MKDFIFKANNFGAMFINSFRLQEKRTREKQIKNDKVLIIRGGHLGDTVVGAEALNALIRYYLDKKKKVHMICSSSTWNLLKIIFDMENVTYLGECNMHSDCMVSKRIRMISKMAGGIDFECIITLSEGSRAHCVVACLRANEKWSIFGNFRMNRRKEIISYFSKKCYTNTVLISEEVSLIKMLEILLHKLGIQDFQTKIVRIPRQAEINLPKRPYITVSVDSANTARRWMTEQFIRLIQLLTEQFDYDIYLIGEHMSKELAKGIQELFGSHMDRIKNIVGKTNLNEWIEWIRGSVFLIGVDSGSIHIATAVGTQSFCLTGEWEKQRAVTYDKESMSTESLLPVCISRSDAAEIHCAGCILYGGRYGYGNRECDAACKKGQPCLCLQKISAEDVMRAINHKRISVENIK